MATGSSGEANTASSEKDRRAQSLSSPRESSAGEDANGSGPSSEHNQRNDSGENESGASTSDVAPLVIDEPGMLRILTSKILNQPIVPPCPRNILDFGTISASVFNHSPEPLTTFQDARCDLSNAWYFFQQGPTKWLRRDVAMGYWQKYSCTVNVMQWRKKMGSKKKHRFFRVIDGDKQDTMWFIDEFRVNIDSPEFEHKLPPEQQYILCKLYRAILRQTPTSSSEHEPSTDSSDSGASSQDQAGEDGNFGSIISSENVQDKNQPGGNLNSDTSSKDEGSRVEDSDRRTSSQDQFHSVKRGGVSSDYSMDKLSKKAKVFSCDRTSSKVKGQ